jgi:hypothetical protein
MGNSSKGAAVQKLAGSIQARKAMDCSCKKKYPKDISLLNMLERYQFRLPTIPLEGWSVGFALSLLFAPLGLKTRLSAVFSSAEEGSCIDKCHNYKLHLQTRSTTARK